MGDRIFFKDSTNTMKGPFTERQVQEWYKKRWFESSFQFYFTKSDETPSDEENSGITLDSLRNLNGFGCPLFKIDEKEQREFEKKRRYREEKLESIEKEIAELHQQCDAVLCMEKTIERMEKEMEKLSNRSILEPPTSNENEKLSVQEEDVKCDSSISKSIQKKKKKKAAKAHSVGEVAKSVSSNSNDSPTAISRPESISAEVWHSFYELGNSVADLILDAFAVYATGIFTRWDKDRVKNVESALALVKETARKGRNLVCEYILVEKMKEKDLFCCDICEEAFFNYKQALIHFTHKEHCKKETAAVRKSGIDGIRSVLDSFTKLPQSLFADDENTERNRRKRHGDMDMACLPVFCPSMQFHRYWLEKYNHLTRVGDRPMTGKGGHTILRNTKIVLDRVKGAIGRRAMAELHDHLAQGPTYCFFCRINTGDRKGLYAHFISFVHMKNVYEGVRENTTEPTRVEVFTTIVNVHSQDFI